MLSAADKQQPASLSPNFYTSISFVGVDLAWKECNNSGLAVFHRAEDGTRAAQFLNEAGALDSIVNFILEHRAETTVVAIDAPLIITNESKRRNCETLISRRFGGAQASAHSTNRELYPDARSVKLAQLLEAEGFRHCTAPDASWSAEGHWFFEVYPHPAQVVLFERERIIPYKRKKGRTVADQRGGLEVLRSEIQSRILGDKAFWSSAEIDRLLSVDLNSLRGQALKLYEDSIDAIFCSYLAFHLWRWGWQRSEMFGDLDSGYIVVPKVSIAPLE